MDVLSGGEKQRMAVSDTHDINPMEMGHTHRSALSTVNFTCIRISVCRSLENYGLCVPLNSIYFYGVHKPYFSCEEI